MATFGPGARRTVLLAALLAACGALAGCARAPRKPAFTAPVEPVFPPLEEGDRARREGRIDDALAAYERALTLRPASIPAHLRLVSTYVATGRRSVARERYAARVRSGAANDVDRVMAARLATDGSADALRSVYADAVRAAPQEAWWRLALAEVDLDTADRSIVDLRAAREAGDRPGAAEALEEAQQALARARVAVAEAAERGPLLADVHLYRGLLQSLEGDMRSTPAEQSAAWADAAASYEAAVAASPGLVDAWAGLADSRQRAGLSDEALAAWLEALRLAPNDADLRRGAGLTLHALDRWVDAARMYRDAALLDPRDATSFLNVGDCLAAAGDFAGAIEAYGLALARDPDAVEAHVKRGAALERLGRAAEARTEYATYLDRGGAHAAEARRRIERIVAAEGRR